MMRTWSRFPHNDISSERRDMLPVPRLCLRMLWTEAARRVSASRSCVHHHARAV